MMGQIDMEHIKENKPAADNHVQTVSDNARLHHSHVEQGKKMCASTVMRMDIAQDMFLVGDVFMRKFYTIFDRQNDRVGLAQAVGYKA